MGIVDEDIARVRESTDLVAVVSGYTQLKRVGQRWSGLCPFHNEKSPSFSVNPEKGVYYCFGCQVRGDVISFVRDIDHLDFQGAVEQLASKFGIALRYTDKHEGERHEARSKLRDVMVAAVDWYHQRLLTGADAGAARRYLRDRGFDGETVRRYRLGWAPDDWDQLAKALRKDFSAKVLRDAGLGRESKHGGTNDFFRARILFPIFDPQGDPIGFGGRMLPGGRPPKYQNTPETSLYRKSKVLYGLNWAKDEAVRSNEVIICEGYTDVIGFASAGLARAVATCGTALTDEHVRILQRFAPRLVLAFDPDAAGQAAADHDGALSARACARPPGRRLAALRGGFESSQRDVALAALPRRLADRESGGLQTVAHAARCGPGGRRGAGPRQPRDGLEQARVPHLRVARRCEAIEEEGIDASDPFRHPASHVAKRQVQAHAALVEAQPMQVVGQRRPRRGEFGGQRGQCIFAWPCREFFARGRMQFDRQEVQPRTALRIGAPCGPGGQEVVAQAEAGLGDDEIVASRPALWQAVAGEKDMPRLLHRAGARVVDISKGGGVRQPFGRGFDARRHDGRGLHGRVASQPSRRSRAELRPR